MKCVKCGNKLQSGKTFCTKCGAKCSAGEGHSYANCVKCGNKLQPGKTFCAKCGARCSVEATAASAGVGASASAGVSASSKASKKLILAIAIIAAAVGAILLMVFLVIMPDTEGKPLTDDEMLELGEEYLLERRYGQALAQFLEVIEIEPGNPRGYTGAADAYVGLGDVSSAEAILKQGLEALPGNTEIETKLREVEAMLPSGGASSADNTTDTSREYVPELLPTGGNQDGNGEQATTDDDDDGNDDNDDDDDDDGDDDNDNDNDDDGYDNNDDGDVHANLGDYVMDTSRAAKFTMTWQVSGAYAGSNSVFTRAAGSSTWYMQGRAGDSREVVPTFSYGERDEGYAFVIEYRLTTDRVYYLFEDGTGYFSRPDYSNYESLTWEFTWS